MTLGTPIGMMVLNEDQRPKDYGDKTIDLYPRPSHADWTYLREVRRQGQAAGAAGAARARPSAGWPRAPSLRNT